jgi:phage anti-repressor protein
MTRIQACWKVSHRVIAIEMKKEILIVNRKEKEEVVRFGIQKAQES